MVHILNSTKKTNKNIRPNYYYTSGLIVFIRVLEELKAQKIHFEINWPLSSPHNTDLSRVIPTQLLSCMPRFLENSFFAFNSALSKQEGFFAKINQIYQANCLLEIEACTFWGGLHTLSRTSCEDTFYFLPFNLYWYSKGILI